ncbi:MAG: DUF2058 family protein [Thiotrichaceae bacterium]|nr:DUF2058 family protein [Thiotrichaceae bacterium]
MATSLQDQLLQAGIVTEEQVQNLENEKQARKKRFQQKRKQPAKKTKKANPIPPKATKPRAKPKKPQSDLERFYKQRASLEKKELRETREKKLVAKKLKKERHEKVCKLINESKLQLVEGEGQVRFNFAIGNKIKYIFVNEEQQKQLSEGEIAITFLAGKKVLIPAKTAAEVNTIDPAKIVVLLD